VLGSTYAMLALGYSLIYRASGYMNFAQPDLLMIGAFLGLMFFRDLGLPFIIVMLLVVISMFFVGTLMERTAFRTLVKKEAKNIYIVLATIAFSIILQNAAMLIWDSRQHGMPPVFQHTQSIQVGNAMIRPESIMAIVVSLSAMILLTLFLNKTKFGTAMRATAQNKIAANAMGINVWRTISVSYGIAAILAGIGGLIVAPTLGVSMNLGQQLGARSFAGAVVGGFGNMYGAMAGAVMIGLVETFVSAYIGSIYTGFVIFFLLIFVMIVRPNGLFNAKAYD